MIGIWFPITKGKFALVDRELYDEVIKYNWHVSKRYACRHITRETKESLHEFVYFTKNDSFVGELDHKNTDGLDCRYENLRVATSAQNGANSVKRKSHGGKPTTTKYKGVNILRGKYIRAYIGSHHIGYFDTIEEAALAYNTHAVATYGEFARLNVIGEI